LRATQRVSIHRRGADYPNPIPPSSPRSPRLCGASTFMQVEMQGFTAEAQRTQRRRRPKAPHPQAHLDQPRAGQRRSPLAGDPAGKHPLQRRRLPKANTSLFSAFSAVNQTPCGLKCKDSPPRRSVRRGADDPSHLTRKHTLTSQERDSVGARLRATQRVSIHRRGADYPNPIPPSSLRSPRLCGASTFMQVEMQGFTAEAQRTQRRRRPKAPHPQAHLDQPRAGQRRSPLAGDPAGKHPLQRRRLPKANTSLFSAFSAVNQTPCGLKCKDSPPRRSVRRGADDPSHLTRKHTLTSQERDSVGARLRATQRVSIHRRGADYPKPIPPSSLRSLR
jgi:hypothetical protein